MDVPIGMCSPIFSWNLLKVIQSLNEATSITTSAYTLCARLLVARQDVGNGFWRRIHRQVGCDSSTDLLDAVWCGDILGGTSSHHIDHVARHRPQSPHREMQGACWGIVRCDRDAREMRGNVSRYRSGHCLRRG